MIDVSLGKEFEQDFFWFKYESKKDLRYQVRKKISLAFESAVYLELISETKTDLQEYTREVLIFNERYSAL